MPEIGSSILGASVMGDSALSRFEIALNDIKSEFLLISVESGYRNDVVDVIKAIRPLTAITEFPEIGLQLGTRTVTALDQTWQVSTGECDVYVQGAVESDANMEKSSDALIEAVESIAHDMTKVMAVIYTKYINSGNGRWNVLNKPYKITPFFDFGKKSNKGVVLLEFKIQLRAMDGTYL